MRGRSATSQVVGFITGTLRRMTRTRSRSPSRRTTLVSYATGDWYPSLLRLEETARGVGLRDLRLWRRDDLVKTPFYATHRVTLDQPRGGGFWLWKPYYILRALEEARSGDAVIYADAGISFDEDPFPLVELCRREGGVLLFAGHYGDSAGGGPNVNSHWTKRDCFVLMDADEPRFHGACQADASPAGLRPQRPEPRVRTRVLAVLRGTRDPHRRTKRRRTPEPRRLR